MANEAPLELEAFTAAVEKYLTKNAPEAWQKDPFRRIPHQDMLEFERELYQTEWYGVWLPEAVGGGGLGRAFQFAFEKAWANRGLPDRIARVGQNMLLPTLVKFGNSSQIDKYGSDIVKGRTIWCQGFSEPGAGSDLASLRTKGEVVEGGYVVNGQKLWTSLAHLADMCFCLVRTDDSGPKQHGITFMFIDMRAAGVESRPIRQIDGGADFSEVFLDDVFVASEDVLGDINNAWELATYTLQHERSTANLGRQARFAFEIRRLAELFHSAGITDVDHPLLQRLGKSEAEATTLLHSAENLRLLEEAGLPTAIPASRFKLFWSEAHQRFTAIAIEAIQELEHRGTVSPREADYWRRLYLSTRAETIYAGTSQIQLEILARRDLGLKDEKAL